MIVILISFCPFQALWGSLLWLMVVGHLKGRRKGIAMARRGPEGSRMIHWYFTSVFAILFLDIPWTCVRLPGPAGEGCIPETRCGAGTHPFYGQDGRDPESFQRRRQHISMWESVPSVDPVLSFEIVIPSSLSLSMVGRNNNLFLSWIHVFLRFLAPFLRS